MMKRTICLCIALGAVIVAAGCAWGFSPAYTQGQYLERLPPWGHIDHDEVPSVLDVLMDIEQGETEYDISALTDDRYARIRVEYTTDGSDTVEVDYARVDVT